LQWTADQSGFQLKNVDLHVKRGELVAVVGMVGSGKSMLIQSLLTETNRVSGRCVMYITRPMVAVSEHGRCLLAAFHLYG
jgi:ABC-type glutathione transport system ATPase component